MAPEYISGEDLSFPHIVVAVLARVLASLSVVAALLLVAAVLVRVLVSLSVAAARVLVAAVLVWVAVMLMALSSAGM